MKPLKLDVIGGKYRTNVPWSNVRPSDPLEAKLDPYGKTTGEPHEDANAIAVYWGEHHIGYFPAETAKELAPLLKQNLIELVVTLAWIDSPSHIQSWVTLKAVPKCVKPSS